MWVCKAAAGSTAFILTDAFLPAWEWRGIDLAATFLNISGYACRLLVCWYEYVWSCSLNTVWAMIRVRRG